MKKNHGIIWILIFATFSLLSCEIRSDAAQIIGKWKVAYVDDSEWNESHKSDEPFQRSLADFGFKIMLPTILSSTSEFFTDNSVKISVGGKTEFGTYKFVGDGKFLEIVHENGKHESNEIVLLTEDTLKFKNEGLILIYGRMKE